MHIEKNVFDTIFNTTMDANDKTKDNVKVRMNTKLHCIRKEFDLKELSHGKTVKSKAKFTFIMEKKELFDNGQKI